jgi:hypothetical protein
MTDKNEAAKRQEDGVFSLLKEGLAKLEIQSQKEYEHYLLPGNPFPFASVAVAETASVHPPLRGEQLEEITRFLRSTIETGHFAGLRVVGDYGFGKTHLLRWLEHQINTAGQGRLLALYVQNPGTTPREFVTRFTAAIGLEELKKRIWVPLLNALRIDFLANGRQLTARLRGNGKSQNMLQPTLFEFDPAPTVNVEDFDSRQKLLDTLRPNPERLREYCLDVLTRELDNYGMARALVDIAVASESSAFRAWTSITSNESPKGATISHEEQFRGILKLLRLTDVRRTYLLFDELEDITSSRLSKRAQAEYQAVLKMLIDQNLNEFALVIAVTENGLNEMRKIYPPFVDRLTHRVDLLPLSEQDGVQMVERYMSEAREGTAFEALDNRLFPFAPDGVAVILGFVNRNPRAFLGFCHRILSWGSQKGVPVFNAEAVNAYLQQAGGR